jgi:hypothetical protein
VLKTGTTTDASFIDGVAVVVSPLSGVMLEAAIGGQQFTYQPKSRLQTMFEGQRDRGYASGDTHAMALEIDRRDLPIRINDDEVWSNPSGNEVGLVEGKGVSDLDCT